MKQLTTLFALLMAACLSACSTTSTISSGTSLEAGAKWALLPLTNHTDTPQAALAAEVIAEHQLRLRGVSNIAHYPATLSRDSLFEPTERRVLDEAQKWAREQGMRYGLQGDVEEWRYKVGIDGEPAVGLTLQVIDLSTGAIVWSASGAQSGWSREALSAVARKVVERLMNDMPTLQPAHGGNP